MLHSPTGIGVRRISEPFPWRVVDQRFSSCWECTSRELYVVGVVNFPSVETKMFFLSILKDLTSPSGRDRKSPTSCYVTPFMQGKWRTWPIWDLPTCTGVTLICLSPVWVPFLFLVLAASFSPTRSLWERRLWATSVPEVDPIRGGTETLWMRGQSPFLGYRNHEESERSDCLWGLGIVQGVPILGHLFSYRRSRMSHPHLQVLPESCPGQDPSVAEEDLPFPPAILRSPPWLVRSERKLKLDQTNIPSAIVDRIELTHFSKPYTQNL
jgi:hypothetical protein